MKLYIFFGSQTGASEEVAYDLAREASKRWIPLEVWSIDDYNLEELISLKLAIFIVSTTGQGEAPDNMKKFWKAIMNKNLPKNSFSNLNFTVFGLGDSSYDDFNVVARKLFIRIKQLGGNPFHDKGLGDDLHDFGYEAEYHPWCAGLWEKLQKFYPLLSEIPIQDGLLPPMYVITQDVKEAFVERQSLKVLENNILSQQFTNTRHIVIGPQEFRPGDTLAVYPPNSEENVDKIMERMQWKDEVIQIQINPEHPFIKTSRYPSSISLKKLLTWYVDLHKPVSRYFISLLAHFSEGLHKEKLLEMSSKTLEGRNEYHRYITKEHRNIVEVLWDFSSIEGLPLSYFLESVGNTRHREFSIASPDNNIEILVSMIHYTTPLGRRISGVCSNYLASIGPNDHIFAHVNRGRMTVPPNEKPVIFIATGTGLAPLRSVLLSRCKADAHKNLLFFGTRHPLHDFYFKDEILGLEKEGKVKAFVAFSQVQEKKYVQDLIREHWEVVIEYLNQDAFVLICGKYRQLVKTIKKALISCLEKVLSPESAVDFVKNMETHRRIYSENW